MLYHNLLVRFREELGRLQLSSDDFHIEIEKCHELCSLTLNEMRRTVIKHGFENQEQEIRFFKEVKVEPMSFLIYYTEVSSFLANTPRNQRQETLRYIKRQISRVDDFLTKQIEFLIYMESKDTHLDPYYFTRSHFKHNLVMHRYPYFKDEDFDTDRDYVLAKIRGFGMYVNYLKQQKEWLRSENDPKSRTQSKKTVVFTGTPTEAAELIYAMLAAGSFNYGQAKISEIIRAFSEILGLDSKEVYKKYGDIKKRDDKVIYLKKLIVAFLRRLEDGDAI